MTFDEAINKLKEYNSYVDSFLSFEAWIDTVSEYIDEIFGVTSTQSINFKRMRSDFEVSKIGLYDESKRKINERNYRLRAKTQVHGFITFLEQKKADAIAEQTRKRLQDVSNAVDKIKKNPLEQPKPEPTQQSPENKPSIKKQMESKERKHYNIGITLFWSVAIPLIGGIFLFGYYVGTTKFDKEKSDMYDENKALKKTTKDQSDTIQVLNFRLNESKKFEQRLYQSLPEKQRDSINNLNY